MKRFLNTVYGVTSLYEHLKNIEAPDAIQCEKVLRKYLKRLRGYYKSYESKAVLDCINTVQNSLSI